MTYRTEEEMREIEYVGKCFSGDLNVALQKAQEFAQDGYVASLPQLIQKRTELLTKGISLRTLRERRITAFSEENVGKTQNGNPILLTVHGGGILNNPERIKNCTCENIREHEPLTPRFQYSQQEWLNLLNGKLPDGTEIPIFTFNDFLHKNDLPFRYGVITDLKQEMDRQNRRSEMYKLVNKNFYGYLPVEVFLDDPLFNIRVGGIKQADEYISALKRDREGYDLVNLFFEYEKADLDKPQGTFLILGHIGGGYSHDEGHIAYHNLYTNQQQYGNFVGVARKALDSLEKIASQSERDKLLKSVIKISKPFVPSVVCNEFERQLGDLK